MDAAPTQTNNSRKFVALDIDGTILDENGVITPAVSQAVTEAVAAGHIVTIATGRSASTTIPVVRELGIDPEYVVCSNGAIVLRRDDSLVDGYRREIVETFDPTSVLTRIRSHLLNAHYAVEDSAGLFYSTQEFPDASFGSRSKKVTFEELMQVSATRVVVISPDHVLEDFLKVVENMGLNQVSYAIGWTAWMDIAPFGINKATALSKVIELLGVASQDVVVAGDGRNDIEMLEWASKRGIAAAMGQAPDEVKAVATRIVAPIEGDGVAELLRSL